MAFIPINFQSINIWCFWVYSFKQVVKGEEVGAVESVKAASEVESNKKVEGSQSWDESLWPPGVQPSDGHCSRLKWGSGGQTRAGQLKSRAGWVALHSPASGWAGGKRATDQRTILFWPWCQLFAGGKFDGSWTIPKFPLFTDWGLTLNHNSTFPLSYCEKTSSEALW